MLLCRRKYYWCTKKCAIFRWQYWTFILLLVKFKVYWPSPVIIIHWNGSYVTSHDIYAASHRILTKLQHYGIDQSYLRKVPYLIDWRFFVCYSVIYILDSFQNNTLKDIHISLLLILCYQFFTYFLNCSRYCYHYFHYHDYRW